MLLLGLRDDLREAVCRIRRNPRISLVATGTLALGIGAATAIFTIAHTYLMAAPPFRESNRMVTVYGWRDSRGRQGVSGEDFIDYLREPNLFESGTLTGYGEISWTGQSLPGFDGAEVLRGYLVTPDYFRVMDHPMAAGRGFLPGEEKAVVISYGLWQRRFGGRGDVIGQTMLLNGSPHALVGVAGRGFLTYEGYEVVAWVPISPATQWRSSRQYDCYARLAAGATLEQAQERLDVLSRRLAEAYPATNANYRAKVEPFLGEMRREARPALLALVGAVLCLLLIAAANVASLLLARAAAQGREMAIRVALGASRFRLSRMVFAESVLLALTASIGGAGLGAGLISGLRALIPASLAMGWAFALDVRVFAATFLLSTLAGLVAGTAPAFQSFEWLRTASGQRFRTVVCCVASRPPKSRWRWCWPLARGCLAKASSKWSSALSATVPTLYWACGCDSTAIAIRASISVPPIGVSSWSAPQPSRALPSPRSSPIFRWAGNTAAVRSR